MQTIDFNTLASQFGTFNKDDLKIGSAEYVRKTLSDMIADVVEALQIAKAELQEFDGFNLPIKNACSSEFVAALSSQLDMALAMSVS